MRPVATALLVLAMLGGSASGMAEPRKAKGKDDGAQLICLRHSTLQLLEGERITDYKIGIEVTRVTIGSRTGSFTISESKTWPVPTELRELILANGATQVYRYGGAAHRYAVMAPADWQPEGKPLLWLAIMPRTADSDDAAIYSRIEVRDPATVKCHQSFVAEGGTVY